MQAGEVDEDAVEPPVPECLDALTGSEAALAEFLRIDRDLVDVAAAGHRSGDGRQTRWNGGAAGSRRSTETRSSSDC